MSEEQTTTSQETLTCVAYPSGLAPHVKEKVRARWGEFSPEIIECILRDEEISLKNGRMSQKKVAEQVGCSEDTIKNTFERIRTDLEPYQDKKRLLSILELDDRSEDLMEQLRNFYSS